MIVSVGCLWKPDHAQNHCTAHFHSCTSLRWPSFTEIMGEGYDDHLPPGISCQSHNFYCNTSVITTAKRAVMLPKSSLGNQNPVNKIFHRKLERGDLKLGCFHCALPVIRNLVSWGRSSCMHEEGSESYQIGSALLKLYVAESWEGGEDHQARASLTPKRTAGWWLFSSGKLISKCVKHQCDQPLTYCFAVSVQFVYLLARIPAVLCSVPSMVVLIAWHNNSCCNKDCTSHQSTQMH